MNNIVNPLYQVFKWLIFLVVGYVVGQGGLNTIVHEFGHYVTIKALYEDCPITVKMGKPYHIKMAGIFPTTHGTTTHPYKYHCAPREGFLSDKYALPVTGYGGGLGTTVFSSLEIMLAFALRKRLPLISQLLIAQAITGIAMEAIYAAFLTNGDYAINTALTGIPRWLPTSIIVGTPWAVWLILRRLEQKNDQDQDQEREETVTVINTDGAELA